MSVCIYDSPVTMCREAYQDGRLIGHISAAMMLTNGFNGHPSMPFIFNVGRNFIPGEIYGDAEAMAAAKGEQQ